MTTIFVTASGTGIGKTHVTRLLLRQLRHAGHAVCALKPVASGFDPAAMASSDTVRLLDAQDLPPTKEHLDRVTPWRFREPSSPDMAAAREGRTIPFRELVDFCRAARDAEVTLVEGIGGLMVPLDERHTVLDWIEALEAPALLVAGSYLGTLSHTLTAAGMLRARRQELAGVIINQSPAQPVRLDETAAVMRRFLTPTPVRTLAQRGDGTPGDADLLGLLTPYLQRARKRAAPAAGGENPS